MTEADPLQKAVNYIDSWLRFRFERLEIPGLAIAIAHKDKILLNKAYGYANLENKQKLTTDHIFRIASHSKTFTGLALMQLYEKDKVDIDDLVIKYVPWLKTHKDRRWQNVTIRQLLSHSAGVIRDGLDCDYWSTDRPFPNYDEFKKELLKADLVLTNNVQMKYSNYGYTLLGLVVEAASGQPYNDYVIKHIVKPLGLKNTGPELTEAIISRLVTGYTRRESDKRRKPIIQINTHAMSPATGFYSTAEDLCRYASGHYPTNDVLLTKESKKKMQRTQCKVPNSFDHDEYGLGIEINFVKKHRLLGHGGGFPGHNTKTLFDPGQELVVVVLTNAIDGGASQINKGVWSVLDWFTKHGKAHSKNELGHFEGRFMNLWEVSDVVASGNKIILGAPNSWEPFKGAQELQYINQKTLKIKKADGFYSPGELMHYTFNNGKAIKVVSAGATLLPEQEWMRRYAAINTIGS